MAYQIRYGDFGSVMEMKGKPKQGRKWIAWVCAVLFLTLTLRLERVQNFLIPGDPDVTRSAFTSFTQELKEGQDFREAAAVFCRQVLESDILE